MRYFVVEIRKKEPVKEGPIEYEATYHDGYVEKWTAYDVLKFLESHNIAYYGFDIPAEATIDKIVLHQKEEKEI